MVCLLVNIISLIDGDSSQNAILMFHMFSQVLDDNVSTHAAADENDATLWMETFNLFPHSM